MQEDSPIFSVRGATEVPPTVRLPMVAVPVSFKSEMCASPIDKAPNSPSSELTLNALSVTQLMVSPSKLSAQPLTVSNSLVVTYPSRLIQLALILTSPAVWLMVEIRSPLLTFEVNSPLMPSSVTCTRVISLSASPRRSA